MKRSLELGTVSILLFILGCTSGDPKFQQYYVQGEQLYVKHCGNCHQKSGKGLGRLYPPLASSDFLKNNFKEAICLIKYGLKGEVRVNAVLYNKPMPGVVSLTELEVAEIATYICNSWGNERGLIDVSLASSTLSSCKP
jgi:mono/diheme cytochrome c family protein